MTKLRTLDDIIQDELKDEQNRAKYLECAVEDYFESGDEIELLLAIRQVVISGIGFTALLKKQVFRENRFIKRFQAK